MAYFTIVPESVFLVKLFLPISSPILGDAKSTNRLADDTNFLCNIYANSVRRLFGQGDAATC
jgi:hypothetical protein